MRALFLAPAEGFGLWPNALFSLLDKKEPYFSVIGFLLTFFVLSGNFKLNVILTYLRKRRKRKKILKTMTEQTQTTL